MGVSIEITGADETVARMEQLAAGLNQPLRQLFESIAEEWVSEFKANIRNQGDSAGPYAPLSLTTQKRRRKLGYNPTSPILIRKGDLIGEGGLKTLLMTETALSVGSDLEKAALLHFGGTTSPHSAIPDSDVPARPFVSLADQTIDDTMEMIAAFVFPEPEVSAGTVPLG